MAQLNTLIKYAIDYISAYADPNDIRVVLMMGGGDDAYSPERRSVEIIDADVGLSFRKKEFQLEAANLIVEKYKSCDDYREPVVKITEKRGRKNLYCPRCRYQVTPLDSFCSKCGQRIKKDADRNVLSDEMMKRLKERFNEDFSDEDEKDVDNELNGNDSE